MFVRGRLRKGWCGRKVHTCSSTVTDVLHSYVAKGGPDKGDHLVWESGAVRMVADLENEWTYLGHAEAIFVRRRCRTAKARLTVMERILCVASLFYIPLRPVTRWPSPPV